MSEQDTRAMKWVKANPHLRPRTESTSVPASSVHEHLKIPASSSAPPSDVSTDPQSSRRLVRRGSLLVKDKLLTLLDMKDFEEVLIFNQSFCPHALHTAYVCSLAAAQTWNFLRPLLATILTCDTRQWICCGKKTTMMMTILKSIPSQKHPKNHPSK